MPLTATSVLSPAGVWRCLPRIGRATCSTSLMASSESAQVDTPVAELRKESCPFRATGVEPAGDRRAFRPLLKVSQADLLPVPRVLRRLDDVIVSFATNSQPDLTGPGRESLRGPV